MSQPKAITFASTMARFCDRMRAGRTFEAGLALGMASGVYKPFDREYDRAQELLVAAHTCAMQLRWDERGRQCLRCKPALASGWLQPGDPGTYYVPKPD